MAAPTVTNSATGVGPGENGPAQLFVGQLHLDTTADHLRELFSYYGDVQRVSVQNNNHSNHQHNNNNCSGFVTYGSTAEADAAIMSLHDRYYMGRERPLQVSYSSKSPCVSEHGYRWQELLHKQNPANPAPNRRGGGNPRYTPS